MKICVRQLKGMIWARELWSLKRMLCQFCGAICFLRRLLTLCRKDMREKQLFFSLGLFSFVSVLLAFFPLFLVILLTTRYENLFCIVRKYKAISFVFWLHCSFSFHTLGKFPRSVTSFLRRLSVRQLTGTGFASDIFNQKSKEINPKKYRN